MGEPAPLGISFPNILFQLANFLIFLYVLYRLLYRPVARMLRERRERIAESLQEAEDLRTQVEEERAGFRAEQAAARAEAQRIREEASRTAETVRAREMERARQEAEQLRTETAAQLERSRTEAEHELRARTADLVMAATARVLDRTIDDPEHRRLVQEALAELQQGESS
jgi:F-type H+-transporting ATPase subunit b